MDYLFHALFQKFCPKFNYLEMPKFDKDVEELETRFDKWLYVLKNLNRLERIPERLRERIFERLFEVAEVAKFTREELLSYEDSLKYYRDLKNSLDTAFEEGKMEGKIEGKMEGKIEGKMEGKIEGKMEGKIEGKMEGKIEGKLEGKIEVIKNGIRSGLEIAVLSKLTGLPEDEIIRILNEG